MLRYSEATSFSWYLDLTSKAVFQGSSTLLLGVGPNEDAGKGHEVLMKAGDVIILPAGVSHCSRDFQDDYRYVGVYPKVSRRCVCPGSHINLA